MVNLTDANNNGNNNLSHLFHRDKAIMEGSSRTAVSLAHETLFFVGCGCILIVTNGSLVNKYCIVHFTKNIDDDYTFRVKPVFEQIFDSEVDAWSHYNTLPQSQLQCVLSGVVFMLQVSQWVPSIGEVTMKHSICCDTTCCCTFGRKMREVELQFIIGERERELRHLAEDMNLNDQSEKQ